MTKNNKSWKARLARTLLYTTLVLFAWVVAGTISSVVSGGKGETAKLPSVPAHLVQQVVDADPGHRFYLVVNKGSCGAPFHASVNYLYNRQMEDIVLMTKREFARLVRGLPERSSVLLNLDNDQLVAAVGEHANALLVERRDDGTLSAYSFDRPAQAEFVSLLDDILGVKKRGEVV